MHLVFERSAGRFKSNCNILTLAWTPYYAEEKFRQALFDYHQKQLMQLVEPERPNDERPANPDESGRVGYLARGHNARLQGGLRRAASALAREDLSNLNRIDQNHLNRPNRARSQQMCNDLSSSNRLDEFCKRCLYSPRQALDDVKCSDPISCQSTENDIKVDLSKTIDQNYGRFKEFGWLLIGNIGKTVGITLTSTIEPPNETREHSSTLAEIDLMLFNEETSDSNHSIEFQKLRPDQDSNRKNHNLRGHLDEVILVKWNELYQKLATIDSKGNVLIWTRLNDKFTIQTPFYNRTKTIADFKWSNDGKTALICYTDSFILVGSSTGQRHWHSMLNLEDYHITCASWTPNDEKLLLGVSNGNIVIIDLPRSELTELQLDNINIRAMSWSTSDINLRSVGKVRLCNQKQQRPSKSAGPTRSPGSSQSHNHDVLEVDSDESRPKRARHKLKQSYSYKVRNMLAVDFASNTIKLFDGGLSDPKPLSIIIELESYIMQWSSDGAILAVAGFNIHTSAPSVGCLRCHYSNKVMFFNQEGKLIHKTTLHHTRYPITAFTWAHEDQRIFIATGPSIHCAKVFFGVPSLELLATSCIQRHTRLPTKTDLISRMSSGQLSTNTISWQSEACTFDAFIQRSQLMKYRHHRPDKSLLTDGYSRQSINLVKQTGNNSNVFGYQLPLELQLKIDQLFLNSIRQPYDESWSMSDIIWHVPRRGKRYFCTLICYANESELVSFSQHNNLNNRNREDDDNHSTNQHKIFILYAEFEGSLIPILRARRIGFMKPEFVIFDPEVSQSYTKRAINQSKVSDISQPVSVSKRHPKEGVSCERFGPQSRYLYSQCITPVASGTNVARFQDNCSQLHQPTRSSPIMDHTRNASTVQDSVDDLRSQITYGRSPHQEPVPFASPLKSDLDLELSRGNLDSRSYGRSGHARLHSNSKTSERSCLQSPKNEKHSQLFKHNQSNSLPESHELVRIKSNVWGTQFRIISVGNRMIREPAIIGSVCYKASILHLQPRQILLNIRDLSNYCCLCSMHHHRNLIDKNEDQATPARSVLKKSESSSKRDRMKSDSKIILGVGDSLRVAPRLERNQKYISAETVNNLKPSTSRSCASGCSERVLSRDLRTIRTGSKRSSQSHQMTTSSKPTSEYHLRSERLHGASVLRSSGNQTNRNLQRELELSREDVLTFTLNQGDQVKVEMSSIRPADETSESDVRLESFLSANKALQSIQSITKKLEQMSQAACSNELDLSQQSEEWSPRKVAKLSNFSSPKSPTLVDCYQTPSTPIHRPRCFNDATPSSLVDTVRRNQVRSRYNVGRDDNIPTDLPPPPSSAPLRRRISAKALRLIDGSLRSIYGSGVFSSTEFDSEEGEVLITRKSKRRFYRDPNSIQSQPVTPLRRVKTSIKNLSDMHSVGEQLTRRLRPSDATRRAWNMIDFKSMTLTGQSAASTLHSPEKSSSLCDSTISRRWQKKDLYSNSRSSSSSSESISTERHASTRDQQLNRMKLEARQDLRRAKLDRKNCRDHLYQDSPKSEVRTGDLEQSKKGRRKKKNLCGYRSCSCSREFNMSNRPPVWNELNQVYQLDFGGRVTQESAKNLQIDHQGNLVSTSTC